VLSKLTIVNQQLQQHHHVTPAEYMLKWMHTKCLPFHIFQHSVELVCAPKMKDFCTKWYINSLSM